MTWVAVEALWDELELISKTALFIFAINITTFLIFAWDKFSARNNTWRVSERTLLLLALAGGIVGAVMAQQWLRHKTSKEPFRTTLYLIAGAQVLLAIALAFPITRAVIFDFVRQFL